MTVDEDVIILTPDAPLTKVRYNSAGWNRSKSRCEPEGDTLYELPIPTEFGYSPDTWDGLTPNACAAILMPDGRTLQQFQPFARCTCGRSGGTCRYRKRNYFYQTRRMEEGAGGLREVRQEMEFSRYEQYERKYDGEQPAFEQGVVWACHDSFRYNFSTTEVRLAQGLKPGGAMVWEIIQPGLYCPVDSDMPTKELYPLPP